MSFLRDDRTNPQKPYRLPPSETGLASPGQAPSSDDEESGLKPAAEVAVRCRDVLKLLSPHHDQWLLEDPERVRYQHPGEDLLFFVQDRKGQWQRVSRLPAHTIGVAACAFRRKRPNRRPPPGGGGRGMAARLNALSPCTQLKPGTPPEPVISICNPPAKAQLLLGQGKDFSAHFINYRARPGDSVESIALRLLGRADPAAIYNHNHTQIGPRRPLYPDMQLRIPVGHDLHVEGSSAHLDTLVLHWDGPTRGQTAVSVQRATPRSGLEDSWQTRIPDVRSGDYTLTARGGEARACVQLTLAAAEIEIVEVIYLPGEQMFLALDQAQLAELQQACRPYEDAIVALAVAYRGEGDEQIAAAKEQVAARLTPLVGAAAETSELTELVHFKGRRYSYVESSYFASRQMRKLDATDKQKRSLLLDNQGRFDFKKLKENFANCEGALTWDLIEPNGDALCDWARSLNRELKTVLLGDDDPKRCYDASAEAQLMRYAYGVGLKGNFDFQEHAFNFKAQGEANLALAEGKASANGYFPCAEGMQVAFDLPPDQTRSQAPRQIDLGRLRTRLELSLWGFAGASVQACANIAFGVEDNQVRLKGTDRSEDENLALAGGAFAGVRLGGEVCGSYEWQNPEENKPVDGQPPAEPRWSCFARAGYAGEALVGGALEGDFQISFEGGKFLIKAKAAWAFGSGASGGFLFSVEADEIHEFVMFVYHKLKDVDFDYLGIIEQEAFNTLNDLMTYVVWAGEELEQLYEKWKYHMDVATGWLKRKMIALGEEAAAQAAAEELAERILKAPEKCRFPPPEVKGRLLRALCPTTFWTFENNQEKAIIAILKTVQTWRDYKEVLEHMTWDGRRIMTKKEEKNRVEIAWQIGEQLLWGILDGAEETEFIELRYWLKHRDAMLARSPSVNTAVIAQSWVDQAQSSKA